MTGWVVSALCTGRAATLPGGKRSAIAKHAVAGPVQIGCSGLANDVQVDRRHHGGPDMAVHIYPLDHHAFWRDVLGPMPVFDDPGAFGGNLAVAGLDETCARIGERFALGSAELEVSQPRMPCATIEHRFERPGMVAAILDNGRCGWYFRVIAEGTAAAGDRLVPLPGTGTPHSVREVFTALAVPARPAPRALLAELADCASLAQEWRDKARRKIARSR